MTHQDILHFWFVETKPEQWFRKDEAFDALIRSRFFDTYQNVVNGETRGWRETPEGRLAEIIVLDQFSRNLFRNSPKAFEHDLKSLELAREAVRVGADRKLPRRQRNFMYLPFMHSESRQAHKEAVWLFMKLLPWNWSGLAYELQHKKIIDRFGRYPHRNAVLGRKSTPEEIEFLKTHSGW